MTKFLKSFFKLDEYNSTIKTEIFAGITTFLTMAYILGVNSSVLSSTGMPIKSVFLATALSASAATLFAGIFANAPLALAPGMGLNAFFTFTVVLTYGYSWQEALAMVFISGVIFLIISLIGIRKVIINSIPDTLKHSIGAGIGFFITFIGLVKMGIITKNPATLVSVASFKNPTVLLAVFGLIITLILVSLKINEGVFFGLIITAIVGIILGKLGISNMPLAPKEIISINFDTSTFFAFFPMLKKVIFIKETFFIVFTMLFVDFFDTAGTFIAVTNKLGDNYNLDRMYYSDAMGTILGSTLGTSNVTTFIETTSGIAAGGKTGLTSVTIGILFLLSTLFSPLLSVVTSINVDGRFLEPVTAPALVVVGIFMSTQLANINWNKFSDAAASFITIVIMILSYSIADGIAAGFIVYVITKLFTEERKEIKPIIYVLFFVFIIHFFLK